MLAMGAAVLAEWTPTRWYRGVVADVVGGPMPLVFVRFDDGDAGWIAAGCVIAASGARAAFAPGERVLAEWQSGASYPGRVVSATAQAVDVAFDDGDAATVSPGVVRRLDEPSAPRASVGARVIARFTNGAWYEGIAEAVDMGGVRVLFDDSDRATVPHDGVRALAAPVPEPPPGAQALARSDTGRYEVVTVKVPSRTFVLVDGGSAGEWMAPVHHVVVRSAAPAPSAAREHRRCAYCQRLSPLDRVQCDHCGAPF